MPEHSEGTTTGPEGRLEPNLPLFLPILLSGNARKFYLFCPKLCQHLPILPEIMPVFTYFENVFSMNKKQV